VEIIEEIEETIEIVENDEEFIEELEETEELVAEETSSRGGITSTMLNVVRNTISAASSSFSNTSASNSTNSVANNNASSSSGISTSNSPSMSEQITSANAQNNMVLSLNTATDDVSSGQTQSVTTIITPLATLDSSPQVVMAEVQVQNMQGEINTAVSGAMTQSEADQIADQIIANNIKEQQEELQEESQETGEYADQSTLVAYLGYVPAFEAYKGLEIPKQSEWYTPRDIYADAVINDNNQAFYGLSTESYNTLSEMIQLQPNL
jgi:ATP-dependent Lon protease